MKIKYKPEVFVIGSSMFHPWAGEGLVGFLEANNLDEPKSTQFAGTDGERIIEAATRACYLSYGKGRPTKEFFANIIESGHGSTLEHGVLTLAISGISRSLSHELVRHRHISISQLSQRYVDQSKLAVVMPPAIQASSDNLIERWTHNVEYSLAGYKNAVEDLTNDGLERKQAREAARSLLPNCVETIVFATASLREWRWFVELRSSKYSDAEIRALAVEVFHIIIKEWPNATEDLNLIDGEVKTPHSKV